jgi:hypothetical protein
MSNALAKQSLWCLMRRRDNSDLGGMDVKQIA